MFELSIHRHVMESSVLVPLWESSNHSHRYQAKNFNLLVSNIDVFNFD